MDRDDDEVEECDADFPLPTDEPVRSKVLYLRIRDYVELLLNRFCRDIEAPALIRLSKEWQFRGNRVDGDYKLSETKFVNIIVKYFPLTDIEEAIEVIEQEVEESFGNKQQQRLERKPSDASDCFNSSLVFSCMPFSSPTNLAGGRKSLASTLVLMAATSDNMERKKLFLTRWAAHVFFDQFSVNEDEVGWVSFIEFVIHKSARMKEESLSVGSGIVEFYPSKTVVMEKPNHPESHFSRLYVFDIPRFGKNRQLCLVEAGDGYSVPGSQTIRFLDLGRIVKIPTRSTGIGGITNTMLQNLSGSNVKIKAGPNAEISLSIASPTNQAHATSGTIEGDNNEESTIDGHIDGHVESSKTSKEGEADGVGKTDFDQKHQEPEKGDGFSVPKTVLAAGTASVKHSQDQTKTIQREVLAVAYVPGHDVLVVSANLTFCTVWDLESQRILKKIHIFDRDNSLMTFNHVKYYASTGAHGVQTKSLFFTDLDTGKLFRWIVTDFRWRSYGEDSWILHPSKDYTTLIPYMNGHSKTVLDICSITNCEMIATASMDTRVLIWDTISNSLKHELIGHTKGVTSLQYCEAKRVLISAAYDSRIVLWDPNAGTKLYLLPESHLCSVIGMTLVGESVLVSLDMQSNVRVTDLNTFHVLQSFNAEGNAEEGPGEIRGIRTLCTLSENRLCFGGKRLTLWDSTAEDKNLTSDSNIPCLTWVGNTRREIIVPTKSDLVVWDALTGLRRNIYPKVTNANITCLSTDWVRPATSGGIKMSRKTGKGKRLFAGSETGEIVVLNACNGQHMKSLTSHNSEILQIQQLPEKIVSLCSGKVFMLHEDVEPKKTHLLRRIDESMCGGQSIIRLSVHYDRHMIACPTSDGYVLWWNIAPLKLESGLQPDALPPHSAPIVGVIFFTSVPLLLTVDSEGIYIFWSMKPLVQYGIYARGHLKECSGLLTEEELAQMDISKEMDEGNKSVRIGAGSSSLESDAPSECSARVLPSLPTRKQILGEAWKAIGVVTCVALDTYYEHQFFVGTDNGGLFCVNMFDLLRRATDQVNMVNTTGLDESMLANMDQADDSPIINPFASLSTTGAPGSSVISGEAGQAGNAADPNKSVSGVGSTSAISDKLAVGAAASNNSGIVAGGTIAATNTGSTNLTQNLSANLSSNTAKGSKSKGSSLHIEWKLERIHGNVNPAVDVLEFTRPRHNQGSTILTCSTVGCIVHIWSTKDGTMLGVLQKGEMSYPEFPLICDFSAERRHMTPALKIWQAQEELASTGRFGGAGPVVEGGASVEGGTDGTKPSRKSMHTARNTVRSSVGRSDGLGGERGSITRPMRSSSIAGFREEDIEAEARALGDSDLMLAKEKEQTAKDGAWREDLRKSNKKRTEAKTPLVLQRSIDREAQKQYGIGTSLSTATTGGATQRSSLSLKTAGVSRILTKSGSAALLRNSVECGGFSSYDSTWRPPLQSGLKRDRRFDQAVVESGEKLASALAKITEKAQLTEGLRNLDRM